MTELTRETLPDAGPELLDPALLQAIRPSASRMASAEEAFVRLLHEEIESLVSQLPEKGWPLCERTARTILWLVLSDPRRDGRPFPALAQRGESGRRLPGVGVRQHRPRPGPDSARDLGHEVDDHDRLGLDPLLHVAAAAPPGRRPPAAARPEAARREAAPETAPQQVVIPGQEAPWRHAADADAPRASAGRTTRAAGRLPPTTRTSSAGPPRRAASSGRRARKMH